MSMELDGVRHCQDGYTCSADLPDHPIHLLCHPQCLIQMLSVDSSAHVKLLFSFKMVNGLAFTVYSIFQAF